MLELHNVSLHYGRTEVLQDVSLRLEPGQRIGVLGPSGAGKSSLLKLAAGLAQPTQGRLRNTFRHPVLVFQEPRLLPWRRVLENIEIPLRAAGMDAARARQRARHWLDAVGLAETALAWPRELSGGMAQRVSLARAFALHADLLLLDEPFSALDPVLRAAMAELCLTHVRETGAALLCISHHPAEQARLVQSWAQVSSGRLVWPAAEILHCATATSSIPSDTRLAPSPTP